MNNIIHFRYKNREIYAKIINTLSDGGYIFQYENSTSCLRKTGDEWFFSNGERAIDVEILSQHHAAFILPYDGEEFVYLGRETKGDIGTYDSFGGRIDDKDECDPLRTACREFEEEGLTVKSLGVDRESLYQYVKQNLCKKIKVGDLVLYLVYFPPQLLEEFQKQYRHAYFATEIGEGLHEKDSIAKVSFADLFTTAIRDTKSVNAEIIDLNGDRRREEIVIRGVLQHLLLHF